MKIHALVLLGLLAVCLPPYGKAQQRVAELKKCPLTVEQSPTVRGLKLGQSPSEIRTLFAVEGNEDLTRIALDLDRRPDETGVREQLISSSMLGLRSDKLKGTRNISIRYLDERLASFQIAYDGNVKWQSSAHFAAAIAEQLHLPTEGWQDTGVALRLTCQGFYVETTAFASSQLKIERTDLDAEIALRRAQLEQRKRAEFKP